MARTMRIAYFSPLAPVHTGTSHYSEVLLPHLCRRMHVDVYTSDRIAAAQEVGRIYPLYGYRDFCQPERYDYLVYQLGNSPEHVPVYDCFLEYGGIVALHDLDLSDVIGAKTLSQGDGWGYLREVKRNAGLVPFLRTAGDALLRGHWPAQPRDDGRDGRRVRPAALQPMNRAVVERADGLIVHSRHAREYLAERYPQVRICEAPLSVRRPPAVDCTEARQLLDLPSDAFICISVGRLGPEKRVNVAMQGFARFLERCPDALYILVGEPSAGYPLQELAETLGIADRVRLPGYVDLATLYRYLAAADVGIGLHGRQPAQISASVLRIMSMGKPVVVCETVSHMPISADCLLQVGPGAGEAAELSAALWALHSHAPMREWYGRAAARYVQLNHSPAATARCYWEFLEELATVRAAEEILLHERTV